MCTSRRCAHIFFFLFFLTTFCKHTNKRSTQVYSSKFTMAEKERSGAVSLFIILWFGDIHYLMFVASFWNALDVYCVNVCVCVCWLYVYTIHDCMLDFFFFHYFIVVFFIVISYLFSFCGFSAYLYIYMDMDACILYIFKRVCISFIEIA